MSFNYCVEYKNEEMRYKACVMGGADFVEKTLEGRNYHIRYYKELGYTILNADIVEFCDTCEGLGETHCKHKSHKGIFVPAKCKKVCKQCKGKKTFPVELPAKWHWRLV